MTPPLSDVMFALTLGLLLLAPLSIAGLALLNTGLDDRGRRCRRCWGA